MYTFKPQSSGAGRVRGERSRHLAQDRGEGAELSARLGLGASRGGLDVLKGGLAAGAEQVERGAWRGDRG